MGRAMTLTKADRDHLLRTLAAVSPTASLVCHGEVGESVREDLRGLGFDPATEAPPAGAEWAVWVSAQGGASPFDAAGLSRLADAVQGGAWVWVLASDVTEAWQAQAKRSGFAVAERPVEAEGRLRVILRRVGDGVVG